MSETLKHWWTNIQTVLNHEIIELGGNSLTLNGIIKLLLVMTLVEETGAPPVPAQEKIPGEFVSGPWHLIHAVMVTALVNRFNAGTETLASWPLNWKAV